MFSCMCKFIQTVQSVGSPFIEVTASQCAAGMGPAGVRGRSFLAADAPHKVSRFFQDSATPCAINATKTGARENGCHEPENHGWTASTIGRVKMQSVQVRRRAVLQGKFFNILSYRYSLRDGAMAAVVNDFPTDRSRFHNMITSPRLQHEHSNARDSPYRPEYNNRPRDAASHKTRSPAPSVCPRSATPSKRPWDGTEVAIDQKQLSSTGDISRFPSPPDSSSSRPPSVRGTTQDTNTFASYMASDTQHVALGVAPATTTARQQPSPESHSSDSPTADSPAYNASAPQRGHTVVVRDLAHIQSLARADLMNGGNGPGILNDPPLQAMKYEISGMPIGDIIEMVAALLTKITTTNDLQHDALHRNATHQQTAANHNNDGPSMSPLSSSVLAFHGKNVPAITILSYLSRIHKYCPTTYEVFLSLLVYFDRMTERVNNLVVEAEETRRQLRSQQARQPQATSSSDASPVKKPDTEMRDASGDETYPDLVDDDDEEVNAGSGAELSTSPATYFVVDSFNIHRLIIAGVTCASKFFSDVFYTNSRYAKVGGLPLAELNHLELQFLLLNDFRLCVPVEDLEAYATMLVEFYAREVVAQRSRPTAGTD
ncbi:putative PHO85 cyclin-6 [Rosellinia necatrix]|uniref:Putative PHO85 cyclin-6 n=1 Tax=Rosellinia necatrix TaxID=77044 RepID=A0A1W2TFP9_ROSNE|nr:putative PHO85 cyclin-6 [Rosellinia necatrix]